MERVFCGNCDAHFAACGLDVQLGVFGHFAEEFSEFIDSNGGTAVLVGGCVRDAIMNVIPRELDIEVFGIEINKLVSIVGNRFGEVSFVGKKFGVFRLKKFPFVDISIPRKETKTGDLHTDFSVEFDVNLPFHEAAKRRDFTINSIGYDILRKELYDPFDGVNDIFCKKLKHTSTKFSEDSLRVLRGMQFISRFDLTADDSTIAICKLLSSANLPRERIFDEFEKMLKFGKFISKGFKFLVDTDWISHFHYFFKIYKSAVFDEFIKSLDSIVQENKCWQDCMIFIGKTLNSLSLDARSFYKEFCYKSKLSKRWIRQL